MLYTVNQLAKLAGISRRTLHYYDEIGLLRPAKTTEKGYRLYDGTSLLTLQQILLYRELGLPLDQVKAILTRPDFDLQAALTEHRKALVQRLEQVQVLIQTVDRTLHYLRGDVAMSPKDFYAGFDEARQKEYAREAQERWGEPAAASQAAWEGSTPDQKGQFLAEMHEISAALAGNMDKGYQSPEVQGWIQRWYDFINQRCFTCSLEVFASLGTGYVEDERFRETYENIKPGMATFMDQAITWYCQQRR